MWLMCCSLARQAAWDCGRREAAAAAMQKAQLSVVHSGRTREEQAVLAWFYWSCQPQCRLGFNVLSGSFSPTLWSPRTHWTSTLEQQFSFVFHICSLMFICGPSNFFMCTCYLFFASILPLARVLSLATFLSLTQFLNLLLVLLALSTFHSSVV